MLEEIEFVALETVHWMTIGRCAGTVAHGGHHALVSLSGFDALTKVDSLHIDGNEALISGGPVRRARGERDDRAAASRGRALQSCPHPGGRPVKPRRLGGAAPGCVRQRRGAPGPGVLLPGRRMTDEPLPLFVSRPAHATCWPSPSRRDSGCPRRPASGSRRFASCRRHDAEVPPRSRVAVIASTDERTAGEPRGGVGEDRSCAAARQRRRARNQR